MLYQLEKLYLIGRVSCARIFESTDSKVALSTCMSLGIFSLPFARFLQREIAMEIEENDKLVELLVY